jgi:hypothetical protein
MNQPTRTVPAPFVVSSGYRRMQRHEPAAPYATKATEYFGGWTSPNMLDGAMDSHPNHNLNLPLPCAEALEESPFESRASLAGSGSHSTAATHTMTWPGTNPRHVACWLTRTAGPSGCIVYALAQRLRRRTTWQVGDDFTSIDGNSHVPLAAKPPPRARSAQRTGTLVA